MSMKDTLKKEEKIFATYTLAYISAFVSGVLIFNIVGGGIWSLFICLLTGIAIGLKLQLTLSNYDK